MGIKAYSYIRFSSGQQARGHSLQRQLERSQRYAAEHGLELDSSLRDLGVSGFKGRNRTEGALGRFLRMVEDGTVPAGSVLLVESLDRLSRESVSTALPLFMGIINAGVTIVTLMDGYRYSRESVNDNWTQLIVSLSIMARGHEESSTKADRLARVWEGKRANIDSRKLTSVCPAWLRLKDDKFEVVEERAAIVRRIFRELGGETGKWKVAARLNAEGVKPFGRGNGWHASMIQKLLHGRAVLGEFQPHRMDGGRRMAVGDPIPDYFPQIVSLEDYERALAATRERRRRPVTANKGKALSNLFAGLAHCGECGGRMAYRNKGPKPKGGTYLICGNAARARQCEYRRLFSYDRLERAVLENVTDIDLSRDAPTKGLCEAREQLHRVEAELSSIKARKTRLVAIGELTEDVQEVADQLVAFQRQQRMLEEELGGLRTSLLVLEQRQSPKLHQEALEELRAEMAEARTVPSDLYVIRSRLAQAIRVLVTDIAFNSDGSVDIILLNGVKNYRLTPDGMLAVAEVPVGAEAGAVDPAVFTGGDAVMARRLERLRKRAVA